MIGFLQHTFSLQLAIPFHTSKKVLNIQNLIRGIVPTEIKTVYKVLETCNLACEQKIEERETQTT